MVFFSSFFKDNSSYQYFYSKTAVEVFIKNKLLQHNITEKFITKKIYMYIKFKYSIEIIYRKYTIKYYLYFIFIIELPSKIKFSSLKHLISFLLISVHFQLLYYDNLRYEI